MDYIYEIIGLLVLIFLIFGFIFLFLHNKKKEDERLADELRNKRKYVKAEVKSAVKVTNNLTSGKVDNSKGIMSKINISNESSKEKLTNQMKLTNPKYTLREWHLVKAYQEAQNGNYEPVNELQNIMTKPYEEQTKEIEEKYYIKKPSDFFGIAGISHVSCSS